MKKYITIFGVLILLYFIWGIVEFFVHTHHIEMNYNEKFTFLFTDSALAHIDTNFVRSIYTKNDELQSYIYLPNTTQEKLKRPYLIDTDTTYYIDIWAFKNLDYILLDSVKFKENQLINCPFPESDNAKGDFQAYDVKSGMVKLIYDSYSFSKMSIKTDTDSEIFKYLNSKNYKGLLGSISTLSLCNENGLDEVFFVFVPKQNYVLFLLYKKDQILYFILINSKYFMDEKILRLLKLN